MLITTLMPATTGTRAFGTRSIGSWLTSDSSRVCYPSAVSAPNHLQFAGVPAVAAFSARGNVGGAVGADAARKRGRPPRGEPR